MEQMSSPQKGSTSSSSSNSSTNGGIPASVTCYDSLEDLSNRGKSNSHNDKPESHSSGSVSIEGGRRQKRSLPRIPADFSRQQQRAFEILASNCSIPPPPPPYLWSHGPQQQYHPDPNNQHMYPIRHVEGRCADQEYFGSVNDNHHDLTNTTAYLGMLPPNNYFSPHNNYNPQEVSSSQMQKKRQISALFFFPTE